MLTSSIYIPRENLSVREIQANKLPFLQILLMKTLVILVLFILPGLLQDNHLIYLTSLLIALQFWTSKNLGRRLLHASWHIDSSQLPDKWIFQAQLLAPSQAYEMVFWYSFVMYEVVLVVMMGLALYVNKTSLACAVSLGVGANAVNFWAFAKIIKLRNNGTLRRMVGEVVGEQGREMEMTVRLPLIHGDNRKGKVG